MRLRTLHTLRADILLELELDGDDWLTPSDLCRRLGLSHKEFFRVALILERLAHEQIVELRNPSSHGKRYFRRRAA